MTARRGIYGAAAMKRADRGPETLDELFEWSLTLPADLAPAAVRICIIDLAGQLEVRGEPLGHGELARALMTLEMSIYRAMNKPFPRDVRKFVEVRRAMKDSKPRPTQEAKE